MWLLCGIRGKRLLNSGESLQYLGTSYYGWNYWCWTALLELIDLTCLCEGVD